VVGCLTASLLGVLALHAGQPLLGVWLLGISVNYLPLAAHAVTLLPPGRLEEELAGGGVRDQLSRASAAQILLVVPFIVALGAAIQLIRERSD
jgi:hypothetical protein